MGTDRDNGDAVLRFGWHRSERAASCQETPQPISADPDELPPRRWTDAQIAQWLAGLPTPERHRVRLAAIHAGCRSATLQRQLLLFAKVLPGLPIGFSVFVAGLTTLATGSGNFLYWLLLVSFWGVPLVLSTTVFALVLVVIRAWAVRTARVPSGDEFEVVLNRVYPLRRHFGVVASPIPPGRAGDGSGAAASLVEHDAA